MAVFPIRAIVTPLAAPNAGQALDFHGWVGWVGDLEEQLDKYHRPGGKGHGTQSIGQIHENICRAWRGEISAVTADAFIKRLQAAMGPAVSIKDSYNRLLKRCKIHSIGLDVKTAKGGQVSGVAAATILIQVSLLVERLPDV